MRPHQQEGVGLFPALLPKKSAQPTLMWAFFVWHGQGFFFFLLEAHGQKLVWHGQSKKCQIVVRPEKKRKRVKKRNHISKDLEGNRPPIVIISFDTCWKLFLQQSHPISVQKIASLVSKTSTVQRLSNNRFKVFFNES
jgi:hypothetical protein